MPTPAGLGTVVEHDRRAQRGEVLGGSEPDLLGPGHAWRTHRGRPGSSRPPVRGRRSRARARRCPDRRRRPGCRSGCTPCTAAGADPGAAWGGSGRGGMSMNSPWCSTTSSTQQPGDQVHRLVDHRAQVGEVVAEGAGLLLGAALAEPDVEAPLDKMSSVAQRSATLTGWFICGGRQMTPWPMLDAARWRRPGTPGTSRVRVMWAYIVSAVCSTAQITSKPSSFGQQGLLDDLGEHPVVAVAARRRRSGPRR